MLKLTSILCLKSLLLDIFYTLIIILCSKIPIYQTFFEHITKRWLLEETRYLKGILYLCLPSTSRHLAISTIYLTLPFNIPSAKLYLQERIFRMTFYRLSLKCFPGKICHSVISLVKPDSGIYVSDFLLDQDFNSRSA